MRVLIFNTGSLADVMQMLPAFTDARRALSSLVIDVIVDERWAEVPSWHPAVGQVFTLPSRCWQRGLLSLFASDDVKRLKKRLGKFNYDWMVDLNGFWSSAIFARSINCPSAGFSRADQKHRSSAMLYNHRQPQDHTSHWVDQVRRLISDCLHYPAPQNAPDYGLERSRFCAHSHSQNTICLMLGAKDSRLRMAQDEAHKLIHQLTESGNTARLLWRDRASGDYLRTMAEHTDAQLMPNLKLSGIASVLVDSSAVISVDNGLSHLAAALDAPMLRLNSRTIGETKSAYGGRQLVVDEGQQGWSAELLVSSLRQLMATMPVVANEHYQKPTMVGAARA